MEVPKRRIRREVFKEGTSQLFQGLNPPIIGVPRNQKTLVEGGPGKKGVMRLIKERLGLFGIFYGKGRVRSPTNLGSNH